MTDTATTLATCNVHLRVRYAESDAMGVLHHSRYFEYFEIGRTELLRQAGFRYRDLEARGILFVVVTLEFHDDKENAAGFEIAVAEAGLAQQLGAADFEVLEISRVVQDAHRIRLGVADAEVDVAGGKRRCGISHGWIMWRRWGARQRPATHAMAGDRKIGKPRR